MKVVRQIGSSHLFFFLFSLWLLAQAIDILVRDGYSYVSLLFVVSAAGIVALAFTEYVVGIVEEES